MQSPQQEALETGRHDGHADNGHDDHLQDLEDAAVVQHHRWVVAEGEGHHKSCKAQLTCLHSGCHGTSFGQTGAGVGRQRHGRRNGGQAGEVYSVPSRTALE